MIELRSLTKKYGSFTAVDSIDLSVPDGELFGFLGPNGAGKTTTLRMIAGILQPTAGSIHLAGIDLATDPLAAKASTTRFGAEALAEQERLKRGYVGLTLPTLVLHGLDDGLVPASASEMLGSLPNVERRTYPGLRHELHNEPEGPAIVAEIIDWIRARTAERATIPA